MIYHRHISFIHLYSPKNYCHVVYHLSYHHVKYYIPVHADDVDIHVGKHTYQI